MIEIFSDESIIPANDREAITGYTKDKINYIVKNWSVEAVSVSEKRDLLRSALQQVCAYPHSKFPYVESKYGTTKEELINFLRRFDANNAIVRRSYDF